MSLPSYTPPPQHSGLSHRHRPLPQPPALSPAAKDPADICTGPADWVDAAPAYEYHGAPGPGPRWGGSVMDGKDSKAGVGLGGGEARYNFARLSTAAPPAGGGTRKRPRLPLPPISSSTRFTLPPAPLRPHSPSPRPGFDHLPTPPPAFRTATSPQPRPPSRSQHSYYEPQPRSTEHTAFSPHPHGPSPRPALSRSSSASAPSVGAASFYSAALAPHLTPRPPLSSPPSPAPAPIPRPPAASSHRRSLAPSTFSSSSISTTSFSSFSSSRPQSFYHPHAVHCSPSIHTAGPPAVEEEEEERREGEGDTGFGRSAWAEDGWR